MADKVEYFTLKSGDTSYYMVITTKYVGVTPMSFGIDIGGKMRGCVQITVENEDYIPSVYKDRFTPEEVENYKKKKKVAYISWVGFNPKCSINSALKSGTGTRHMLRTAMIAVMDRYKWIKFFKLDDASEIECSNGAVVSLQLFSILTNNKSYYEKYYGATLMDEDIDVVYKKCLDKMKTKPLSFAEFLSVCGRISSLSTEDIEYIEGVYEASTSFLEFFNNIKKQVKGHTKKDFCEFVNPWGMTFVANYILNGDSFASAKWIIEKEKFLAVNASTSWIVIPTNANANIDIDREKFAKARIIRQQGGHFIGYEADIVH